MADVTSHDVTFLGRKKNTQMTYQKNTISNLDVNLSGARLGARSISALKATERFTDGTLLAKGRGLHIGEIVLTLISLDGEGGVLILIDKFRRERILKDLSL